MGAPPEIIEKKCSTDLFEVDYYNWAALEVFQTCCTQWRVISGVAGAVPQGLDYSSVESVMRILNVKDTKKTFQKLQYIERGYLEKVSEKR